MKVIQSSLFRAFMRHHCRCPYSYNTENRQSPGLPLPSVYCFSSRAYSLTPVMSAKRSAEKMKGQYLYDAQGNHIIGMRPNFPLVGLGSLIFGLILALIAKRIHRLADVHPLGNTDYGRPYPNGEPGICSQDGQSGYRILADAYTPAAVGSVYFLFRPSLHCLCPTAGYRLGYAGIWRSGSRQCHEGFPTTDADGRKHRNTKVRTKAPIMGSIGSEW